MFRRLMLWSTVVVISCLVHQAAFAENEPNRGRLPDGRAYRTDEQGTQLVDYIAELEVNVEQLSRQVQSLQDEVKEKQTRLERLEQDKNAVQANQVIAEKDLLSGQKQKAEAVQAACPPPVKCETPKLEPLTCPSCPAPVDCKPQLAKLSEQLEGARSDLEVERQLAEKHQAELTAAIEELKGNLESSNADLEKTRLELSQAQSETAQLRSTAEELRHEAEEKAEEAEAMRARIDLPEAPAPNQVGALRLRPATASSGMNTQQPSGSGSAFSPSGGSPALSLARARAVDSIRGRMLTDLNQIQSQIVSRDEMYHRFSQKKRAVAFKPSAAVSSRNNGLKEIAAGIKGAGSVSELSVFGRELSEIQSRIQDDMSLMQRMEKVG
jgi:hypothetical protein